MKKLITATTFDGKAVYGKLIGTYNFVVDTSGPYHPGWVPDYDEIWYDAMETIDGKKMAVEGKEKGKLFAFEPGEGFDFYEGYGEVASNEYGERRNKRGHHSTSNNRKANRNRIFDEILDGIFL